MITDMHAAPLFPPSLVFQDVDDAVLEDEARNEQSSDYRAWAVFMTQTLTFPKHRAQSKAQGADFR